MDIREFTRHLAEVVCDYDDNAVRALQLVSLVAGLNSCDGDPARVFADELDKEILRLAPAAVKPLDDGCVITTRFEKS